MRSMLARDKNPHSIAVTLEYDVLRYWLSCGSGFQGYESADFDAWLSSVSLMGINHRAGARRGCSAEPYEPA
jgi:hypothetical protein